MALIDLVPNPLQYYRSINKHDFLDNTLLASSLSGSMIDSYTYCLLGSYSGLANRNLIVIIAIGIFVVVVSPLLRFGLWQCCVVRPDMERGGDVEMLLLSMERAIIVEKKGYGCIDSSKHLCSKSRLGRLS
ncbi:hypothetical protein ACLOJK_015383 [Asimina triloba]